MRNFITYTVAVVVTAAIAVVWGVSAAANWYFGASQGSEALVFSCCSLTTAGLYGWASLAVDTLKALMLFLFFGAVANRQILEALATVTIWLICTAWSFNAAIGFVALNHSTVVDSRSQSVTNWEQLQKDIRRIEERRDWVPKHRPYETVEAELAGKTTAYLYALTSGCTNVTFKGSRPFCEEISRLRQEEVSAKAGNDLDAELSKLRDEQKGLKKVSSTDPWAEMIAMITGSTAEKVSTGRATGFAFLVEIISALGLWSVWSVASGMRRKPAQAAEAPRGMDVAGPPVTPALPRQERAEYSFKRFASPKPDDTPPADAKPVAELPGAGGGGAPAESKLLHGPWPQKEPEPKLSAAEARRLETIEAVKAFADEVLTLDGPDAQLARTPKGFVSAGGTPGKLLGKQFRLWAKASKKWAHLRDCSQNPLGKALSAVIESGRHSNSGQTVYAAVLKDEKKRAIG
jgi:hypothetical protein